MSWCGSEGTGFPETKRSPGRFPAARPRLCRPHPLAELRADGGPVAAPAAQEAPPLSVPAGGIGTQLAPAPACRHKAKDAALQVTAVVLSSHPFTQQAGYLPLARCFPVSGHPKPKNNPRKRKLLLKPRESQRRNGLLCTEIPPERNWYIRVHRKLLNTDKVYQFNPAGAFTRLYCLK